MRLHPYEGAAHGAGGASYSEVPIDVGVAAALGHAARDHLLGHDAHRVVRVPARDRRARARCAGRMAGDSRLRKSRRYQPPPEKHTLPVTNLVDSADISQRSVGMLQVARDPRRTAAGCCGPPRRSSCRASVEARRPALATISPWALWPTMQNALASGKSPFLGLNSGISGCQLEMYCGVDFDQVAERAERQVDAALARRRVGLEEEAAEQVARAVVDLDLGDHRRPRCSRPPGCGRRRSGRRSSRGAALARANWLRCPYNSRAPS